MEQDLINSQIERYLKRLSSHLYGADQQVIDDILEEIRQHLRAGSDTLICEGYPADQAVRTTLKRFGRSDKVGRSLARRLAPHAAQSKAYIVLRLNSYARFIAIWIACKQSFGVSHGWRFIIWGIAAPVVFLLFLRFSEERRRLAVQPGFIVRLRLRNEEIQRELRQSGIDGQQVFSAGSLAYLCLIVFLILSNIRSHSYAWAIFWMLEVFEHVFIKIVGKRAASSVSR